MTGENRGRRSDLRLGAVPRSVVLIEAGSRLEPPCWGEEGPHGAAAAEAFASRVALVATALPSLASRRHARAPLALPLLLAWARRRHGG